jgi:hypothetical protein
MLSRLSMGGSGLIAYRVTAVLGISLLSYFYPFSFFEVAWPLFSDLAQE